jgi:Asp-tRNA(Asn)/Glu-tRNA(Gln) amidotransferase A subunit family amidase
MSSPRRRIPRTFRLDGTAPAELVREKSVRPIELVEAAIKRIERLNPKLNAVVTPMYDRARAEASVAVPEGPFAGVPFLLKDLLAEYAGVRFTEGSAFVDGRYTPDTDSELTRRRADEESPRLHLPRVGVRGAARSGVRRGCPAAPRRFIGD